MNIQHSPAYPVDARAFQRRPVVTPPRQTRTAAPGARLSRGYGLLIGAGVSGLLWIGVVTSVWTFLG